MEAPSRKAKLIPLQYPTMRGAIRWAARQRPEAALPSHPPQQPCRLLPGEPKPVRSRVPGSMISMKCRVLCRMRRRPCRVFTRPVMYNALPIRVAAFCKVAMKNAAMDRSEYSWKARQPAWTESGSNHGGSVSILSKNSRSAAGASARASESCSMPAG